MMKSIETTVVTLYTLLIFNDYFGETYLASKILEGIVLQTIVVCLVILNIYIYEKKEKEEKRKWHFFNGVYILFLLAVMPIVGGESKLGITLLNPLVWLLLVFMMKEEFFKYLKENRKE